MEVVSIKDLISIFTLIGLVGAMWITIIKTIRTEVGRIEKVVENNSKKIEYVKNDLSKTKTAFNREFVTKDDLKDRLNWHGHERREHT